MCDQAPSVDHRPSLAGLRRLTGGGMVSPCRWSISIIINYQSLSLISRQHLSSTLALVSALLRSMDTTTSVLTPGISSLLIQFAIFLQVPAGWQCSRDVYSQGQHEGSLLWQCCAVRVEINRSLHQPAPHCWHWLHLTLPGVWRRIRLCSGGNILFITLYVLMIFIRKLAGTTIDSPFSLSRPQSRKSPLELILTKNINISDTQI